MPLSIVKSVQSLVNLTNRKSNNKIYIKVPPVVQYRPPEYNPRDQESNLIWPGQGVRGSGQSREDQNPRDWNQRRGKFQEDGLSRSNFFNLKIWIYVMIEIIFSITLKIIFFFTCINWFFGGRDRTEHFGGRDGTESPPRNALNDRRWEAFNPKESATRPPFGGKVKTNQIVETNVYPLYKRVNKCCYVSNI